MAATLTVHALPPSHPCMTVVAAIEYKGVPYERGSTSRPAARREDAGDLRRGQLDRARSELFDGEPVHGLRGDPGAAGRRSGRSRPCTPLRRCGEAGALGRRGAAGPSAGGLAVGGPSLPPGGDGDVRAPRLAGRARGPTTRSHTCGLRGSTTGSPPPACKEDNPRGPAREARITSRIWPAGGSSTASPPPPPTCRSGRRSGCCFRSGDLRPLLADSAGERVRPAPLPELPRRRVPAGAYPAGWTPGA